MKLTSIEEQILAKTMSEVQTEVRKATNELYRFLENNRIMSNKIPLQTRGQDGKFVAVGDFGVLYYKLQSLLVDAVLKERTQKAINNVVKKLTAEDIPV